MYDEIDVASAVGVHEYLVQLARDRETGGERSLAEYQALFPDHADAIAAAHEELREPVSARRLGRFELVEEIGRGGQGEVWLARDTHLLRSVALKLLSARGRMSRASLARFRREAEATSRLDHPGICAVYDVGESDGVPWIAMRYVDGQSLAERIAHARAEEQPLPIDEALRLTEQIARTLHAAHEAGIVHRDVKPANVRIPPSGDPVVLDFGLARVEESDGPSLTRTGEAFGTPAYMAPEQVRASGDVDRRADVYALGATLYECLTLVRPHESPTVEGLYRAVLEVSPSDPRLRNPEVPRDLATVLATALEKLPRHRYATALDLAEDLRRVREREPIRARPAGTWLRLARWSQRNPRLAAASGGLVAVLVLGLAVTSVLLGQTRASLEEVARLSDLRALPFLVREADEDLWPAVPEKVAALDVWLGEARDLLGRLPEHRATLDAVRARGTAGPIEVERLTSFVADLGAFDELVRDVAARRDFAATVFARTIEDHRDGWSTAISAVARDPRFGGLELEPQLGLVPLGPDPVSGLFEFAHPQTGEVPERDPETGLLGTDETTGLVLVLLPGGAFEMGSEEIRDSRPVHDVTLDPFFLSKFEMTQAQWRHVTGENPSTYFPGRRHSNLDARIEWSNPVETVSWREARDVLARLDLTLPTEAQWEFACRAGTRTVWYTGDESDSLRGHANLADEAQAPNWGGWAGFMEGWDDGYLAHAPVGTYLPNPFGLYDMAGNVIEWCLDWWGQYVLPTAPGNGERLGSNHPFPVQRGGSYNELAPVGRSAARGGNPPQSRGRRVGLRPARPVVELERRWDAVLPVVREAFDRNVLPDRMVAYLAQRDDLDDEVRQLALDLARRWPPYEIADRAWTIVIDPMRTSDEYERALGWVRHCTEQMSGEYTYLITLGIALYRAGHLEEARDALQRSERISRTLASPTPAYDLLFLAMVHQRLGEEDEARRLLEEARPHLAGAGHGELAGFLREAEQLISSD